MQRAYLTDFDAMTTICQSPAISIEEAVVNVYFRNFARLYRTQDTVRGFLPFLAPMYGSSSKDSLLRTATHAAALCAISQLPDQKHLQYRAADTYGKAMRIAAHALQDPIQSRSDETLQATLLLCLYEVSTRQHGRITRVTTNYLTFTVHQSYGQLNHRVVKSRRRCECNRTKQRTTTTGDRAESGTLPRCKNSHAHQLYTTRQAHQTARSRNELVMRHYRG